MHVLMNYLDDIRSLDGELQGLNKDTLSPDDMGESMRKAFNIKGNLLDLHVAISHLTEPKNEPTSLGI